MVKLNISTIRLIIKSTNVGVKSPVTGTGIAVAEEEAVGMDVGFIVADGLLLAAGVGVAPELDAVKAGISPALTTKSLVKNLVIPLTSIQEIVMV